MASVVLSARARSAQLVGSGGTLQWSTIRGIRVVGATVSKAIFDSSLSLPSLFTYRFGKKLTTWAAGKRPVLLQPVLSHFVEPEAARYSLCLKNLQNTVAPMLLVYKNLV